MIYAFIYNAIGTKKLIRLEEGRRYIHPDKFDPSYVLPIEYDDEIHVTEEENRKKVYQEHVMNNF